MKISEKSRFYKLYLVLSRFRYGLVLFSIRNLLSRIGFDIDPYYLVQEGFKEFDQPKIKGINSEYSVKQLSYDETRRALLKSSGMSIHIKNLKENLENGQFCLGLMHKNELAAFMFVATKILVFKSKEFVLNKDEAFLLMMYTFEAHRGKNLAPYLRSKSYEMLKEGGINKIYSLTSYFNTSSKKFKNKLNAKNIEFYLRIELFKAFHKHFHLRSYK